MFATAQYEDPELLKIILYNDDNSVYKEFFHTNPLVVWFEFYKTCYQDSNIKNHITVSSSFNHWFFDTDDYEEKYFHPETGEWHDWRNDPKLDTKGYPRCVVRKSLNFNDFFDLKKYISKLFK